MDRGARSLKFSVLGSSSAGNCTLVSDGTTTLLFDAGLPLSYTSENVRKMTIRDRIDGIFISHEHIDHTRYMVPLARRYSCPVYLSQAVSWFLGREPLTDVRTISDRSSVMIGTLRVTPFVVPHDALDPFGFIVENDMGSLGIVTDCGSMDERIMDLLRDKDALVIESNYDRDMLLNGRYPAYLKARIDDPKGHLSNQMCRDILREVIGPRTRQVVLAHLSEENNDPLLALNTTMEAVSTRGSDVTVQVSYPRYPTALMNIEPLVRSRDQPF